MLTPRTVGVFLMALLSAPLAAGAAPTPILTRFDVEHFHPPALAECSLAVGCAEVGPPGSVRAALAAMGTSRPLVLRDQSRLGGGGYASPGADGDVVGTRGALLLSLAYTPLDSLELHGSLSLVASQSGDDFSNQAVPSTGSWGTGTPSLGVRWAPLSSQRGAPVSLALALDVLPPLGWRDALAGTSQWLYAPRLEAARWSDDAVLAAEVGLVARGRSERLGADRLGSELAWGLTVAGRSSPLRGEVALRGWVTGSTGSGLEALVGFRLQAGDLEVFALAGPGFGRAPGTPNLRGMAGVAWTGRKPGPATEQEAQP